MKRFIVVVSAVFGLAALGLLGVSTGAVAGSLLPQVTLVSPAHGPTSGGTIVDIDGTNLVNVTAVSFGTASATFVPKSNTRIVAVAPAGTGSVDIVVTTTVGPSAAVAADTFTYVTTPTIQSLTPRIGSSAGGNRVTISGAGFTGVTAVDFGATAATSFVVDSPNAISAISPAGAVGTVEVSVSAASGTTPSDPAAEYTYVLRVPVVTSVVFDVGNVAGGEPVTITGQRFLRNATVLFGDVQATTVQYKNSSRLIVLAPPGGAGTVEITVSTSKGASVLNPPMDEYMYTATGP